MARPTLTSSAGSTISSAGETRVIFQHVRRDEDYGHVATLPSQAIASQRQISDLICERVHFAAGRGLCLVPESGFVTTYHAVIFDGDFQPIHRVELSGPPSRARVSPDGRYGAATAFVFGHSYAEANFSTQTILIDMVDGTSLGDMEDFTVIRDGADWSSEDFNFWGVTFSGSDSNTFYATLRSGGRTYLVKGDVQQRAIRVVTENVECPSLSPDGSRIAFKKLTEGLIGQWRLHVMDLVTLEDRPLAEEGNVDDQVEWFGEDTILYGIGGNIWQVSADGSGAPSMFIADALSPAVVP